MKEYIQVKKKKKQEFSKWLLIQESLLIWFISVSFIILAFLCVINGYLGTLPWLAAMVSFPWAAYGVSQAFYYRKSQAENTKAVLYMKPLRLLHSMNQTQTMAFNKRLNEFILIKPFIYLQFDFS